MPPHPGCLAPQAAAGASASVAPGDSPGLGRLRERGRWGAAGLRVTQTGRGVPGSRREARGGAGLSRSRRVSGSRR